MGTFMRTMMMMSSTHNHMMSLCGQTLDALVTHAKAGDIGTDDALVLMRATQHCMEAHKAAVDAQLVGGHTYSRGSIVATFFIIYMPIQMQGRELVVARYKEDVEWVRDWLSLFDRVTIYNKSGAPLAFRHPKVTVVPLPNVGRESHTYAHHFEQRWGYLSDSVVCCQGGFDDHLSHADFEAMVLGHGQSVAHGLDVPWDSTMMAALHWTPEKNYAPQPMQPAGMTLAQYFLKYIDDDLVPGAQLQWWVGAIFRVTASDVRRHPPARYSAIKRSLESGSNPEAGHYMERFWRALLLGTHSQFDRASPSPVVE